MATDPTVTVVIPTCNRPNDLERCLQSLKTVRYSSWNVLIIDQSDDSQSESVAEQFRDGLPCLTYQHADWKGASRARNAGMQLATGELVAFLDDDCTVAPDWLHQLATTFARHPEAGLVCGRVTAAAHDPNLYYIPTCDITQERVLSRRTDFLQAKGISAAMYLRRSLCHRIGRWDEGLGPGAHFPGGGEDRDYVYRVLAAGLTVVETPAVEAQHYGTRAYRDSGVRRLFRAYDYSQGALDMKLLRCGDLHSLGLIATHIGRFVAAIDLRQLILRQGPTRVARLLAYLSGLRASFQVPVDRTRCVYMERKVLSTIPLVTDNTAVDSQ